MNNNTNEIINNKTYENDIYKIKLQYPESWDIKEDLTNSQIAFLPNYSIGGKFIENVSINIQDLSLYKMNLENYLESSLTQLKQVLGNFQLLKCEGTNLSNSPAYLIEYSHNFQNEYTLITKQVFTVMGSKVYLITHSFELGYENEDSALLEKFINNFQINITNVNH